MATRKLLLAFVALSTPLIASADAVTHPNDTAPTVTGATSPVETPAPESSQEVAAAGRNGGGKEHCRDCPPKLIEIEICGKHCPGGGGHHVTVTETYSVPYTVTVKETITLTETQSETITATTTKSTVTTTTDLEVTTDYVETTSTEFVTTSYPYTITVSKCHVPTGAPGPNPSGAAFIGLTHPEECVISTTTAWTTTVQTTTRVTTKTEVQVSPTTTTATTTATTTTTGTKTKTTTSTELDTISTTLFESTTLYSTVTFNTSFPVTVISDHTVFTTVPTTVISTITTSYPVTITDVVTRTKTDTTTDTTTLPGSVTTLPGSVTTLPGTTSVITVTSIIPPVTTTVTEAGTTVTTVLPGTTLIVTETVTGPPVTVTRPPETVTIATTIVGTVTTCAAPQNTAGSAPAASGASSDLTWGCKPGFVCSPGKPDSCNIWADSPADDFTCRPSDCIPSPNYPVVQWPANETGYYPPTDGYFNLAPHAFGLSYDIFEEEVIIQKVGGHLTSIVTGNWASQSTITHYPPASTEPPSSYPHAKAKSKGSHWKRDPGHMNLLSKRDETICPAVCYDTCNNCYLEAQAVGKSPGLCAKGSPFKEYYDACLDCIEKNAPDTKVTTKAYLEPKFFQFLSFCDAMEAQPQTTKSGPQSEQSAPPDVETSTQGEANTNTNPIPITSTSQTEVPSSSVPSSTVNSATPSATSSSSGGGSSGGDSTGGGSPGGEPTTSRSTFSGGSPGGEPTTSRSTFSGGSPGGEPTISRSTFSGGSPGGEPTTSRSTFSGGGSTTNSTGPSSTSPIVTVNDGFRSARANLLPLFFSFFATILLI